MSHPSFGPFEPEQFARLRDAPYGKFAEVVRKHDPLWGADPETGAPKRWRVRLERSETVTFTATVEVEAADEHEAEETVQRMADNDSKDIVWGAGETEEDFPMVMAVDAIA